MNRRIKYSLTLVFILNFAIGVIAQETWIPKIAMNLPITSPIHEDIKIDLKAGISIGAEYKTGGKKVHFNSGLYYVRNSADLLRIDTLNETQPPLLEHSTSFSALKLVLGGSAVLTEFSESSNMHLRAAFIPVINIGSPEYGQTGLDSDFQKGVNWEFQLGIGFDISKIVIDFDFNLSLLKEFRDADIVRNAITIGLGYKL